MPETRCFSLAIAHPKPEQPGPSPSTSASPDRAALIPSEQRMDSSDKLFASQAWPTIIKGLARSTETHELARPSHARRGADPLGRAPSSRRLEWARGKAPYGLRRETENKVSNPHHGPAPFPSAIPGPCRRRSACCEPPHLDSTIPLPS